MQFLAFFYNAIIMAFITISAILCIRTNLSQLDHDQRQIPLLDARETCVPCSSTEWSAFVDCSYYLAALAAELATLCVAQCSASYRFASAFVHYHASRILLHATTIVVDISHEQRNACRKCDRISLSCRSMAMTRNESDLFTLEASKTHVE